MDIFDQLNQQFEEDTKDEHINTEKIKKEDVIKDNEKTAEWLEKQKAFIMGNHDEDTSDEFFKKKTDNNTSSIGKSSNEKTKKEEEKKSPYSSPYSSSSSSTKSSGSPYKSSTQSTKTKQELYIERCLKYATKELEDMQDASFESAIRNSKIISNGVNSEWDIFDAQKQAKKKRSITESERLKASRKLDFYVIAYETVIETIAEMKSKNCWRQILHETNTKKDR